MRRSKPAFSSMKRERWLGVVIGLLLIAAALPAAGAVAKDAAGEGSFLPARKAGAGGHRAGPVHVGRVDPVEAATIAAAVDPRSDTGNRADAADASRGHETVGISAAPAPNPFTGNGEPGAAATNAGPIQVSVNPMQIVAVGPDDVMRVDTPPAMETTVRISDRTGAAVIAIPIADFFKFPFGATYGYGFDPRIAYDSVHGRWVAIAAQYDCIADPVALYGHGFMHFAISTTADPRQPWTVYRYEYIDQWVMEPGLGISTDKLVITARIQNLEQGDCAWLPTEAGWDMTVLEWSDVLGHTSFPEDYYFPVEPIGARTVKQLQPALQQPVTSAALHMVGQVHVNGDGTEHAYYYETTGPVPGSLTTYVDLTEADLVAPFGTPGPVPTGIGTNYLLPATGPTNAVWHDDRLAVTSTEGCTPLGDSQVRACARVIELDTSADVARRQDVLVGYAGLDTYGPGVAYSQQGDLHLTFERSSGTEMPNGYAVVQRRDDDVGEFSDPRLLLAATDWMRTHYDGQRIRNASDPLDPESVWTATTAGGDADGQSLRTVSLSTAAGATFKPITPLRILDTRDGTGLSGIFAANVPRTFNVAGAGAGAIPSNAIAVTGNVTVVGHTAAGYVAVGPTKTSNPASSTVNVPVGDNRANNVTLPLDGDGDLAAVYKAIAGTSTNLVFDVTGYFLADDSGATYQPISSARILDSRIGTGLAGKFEANVPRSFQVTGVGGVPDGATAVTGNVTVVGQSKAGFISLTPTPDAAPTTSTLNFPFGDVRANGVTVPLSDDGMLSAVYKAAGGTTDIVFDVTGYYLEGPAGLRFFALNPGRIMDTRTTTLSQLTGQFNASTPRTLVTGGHFGVPSDALAVTGNLTVVGQTKAGYVAITKDPTATPPVSTLNFPLADIRANGITVPLNAANDMAIVYKAVTGGKTHLVMDLTGYFK